MGLGMMQLLMKKMKGMNPSWLDMQFNDSGKNMA